MLLISFVVIMLSVIVCMHVCSSIREERLCRLLELNKLLYNNNNNNNNFRKKAQPVNPVR